MVWISQGVSEYIRGVCECIVPVRMGMGIEMGIGMGVEMGIEMGRVCGLLIDEGRGRD